MIADIGIDLGTRSILIYGRRKILLNEPSVVALDVYNNEVICLGREAEEMRGKTPDRIKIIRPLSGGVISDYTMTSLMVNYFIRKVCYSYIIKPRVAICVPSGITNVELRAAINAAYAAEARKVFLIDEPVAAAIGAGVDFSKAKGVLMLDIGGGTTDVALLSMDGIISKSSVKIAGDSFDEAIAKYIQKKYNLIIGEVTAEKIKLEIGTLSGFDTPRTMTVKGRSASNGLPAKIEVSWQEISAVLTDVAEQIMEVFSTALESAPPELVGDLKESGVVMTGGGVLLHGFDRFVHERIGIAAKIAPRPIECVAIGTGKSLDMVGELKAGFKEVLPPDSGNV
ncbi:MAG: rod shape-determining protein [Oscillospiraceae bacterium]|nr:rod shape-determining protein [Oscillospiraceae bacterium]